MTTLPNPYAYTTLFEKYHFNIIAECEGSTIPVCATVWREVDDLLQDLLQIFEGKPLFFFEIWDVEPNLNFDLIIGIRKRLNKPEKNALTYYNW